MEEILASIRRIIEDSDTGAADAPAIGSLATGVAPSVEPEPVSAEIATFRAELSHPPVAGNDARPSVAAMPHAEPPVFQTRVEPPVLQPARSIEPSVAPAAGTMLSSPNTGRKVAAAFDELSDAFALQRRRSLDEMAEEMLRPMLREWLDENLPTMVERLVREEIERIARGDRS